MKMMSFARRLREAGIGTSATRAEILKKLVSNGYLSLNAKTQIIKPQKLGEAIYEVVAVSIRQLLNPELTASWGKGTDLCFRGYDHITGYMDKLQNFVARRTQGVKQVINPGAIRGNFAGFESFYETSRKS